ncbi:hypothetical protein H0H92_011346 [Tricholoma furcatifolium]|nr:hypothetical protein H0H92_011346 [Tricholoma furcatifolium]
MEGATYQPEAQIVKDLTLGMVNLTVQAYQFTNGVPEALAPLSIRQTEAGTLSGMIYDLTSPLVTKRMKDRDTEGYPVQKAIQKAPFDTAAFKLAANVVEEAYSEVKWKMLKKGLYQDHCVVLLLPSRAHIHDEKDDVMATQQSHESRVIEELRTGLLAS